jgi:CcmD family protein
MGSAIYLYVAYAAAFILLGGYSLYLARRLRSTSRELDELKGDRPQA